MFSDFNLIFQVVGVHPGRGGEGASNDGLQGLDHFVLLDHRHSVQCNVWFGLVLFGVAPFLSLAQHQMRKKTISFSQFKTLGRIFSAK